MRAEPERLTLLQEKDRDGIWAYGMYYHESEVRAAFPLHGHTFYELELVTGGAGRQWINGHGMALSPGSFYLLTPTDLHRLEADERLTFLSVKLPPDALPAPVEKLLDPCGGPAAVQLPAADYDVIRRDFLRLKGQLSIPSSFGEISAQALITLLIAGLFERAPQGPAFSPDTVFRRQHAVLTYIQNHYLSPVSLNDIARVAGLSPNHVCAQFAKVAGCGYVEYLTRLRLQHACTLLAETSLSVTEVAFASGFGSLSHFLRLFKAHRQTTPHAYRAAVREAPEGER